MNFKQHVSFALWIIAIIDSILIASYFDQISVVLAPFIFVLGAITPDIDLPKESKETRYLFLYGFPLFVFSFLLLDLGFWAILAAILTFLVAKYIDKTTMHWGYVHSVGFMAILSIFVAYIVSVPYGIESGQIVGIVYAGGFFSHLLGDEIYHQYKGKKDWNRFSLKIWNNKIWIDPLIILSKITRRINRLRL